MTAQEVQRNFADLLHRRGSRRAPGSGRLVRNKVRLGRKLTLATPSTVSGLGQKPCHGNGTDWSALCQKPMLRPRASRVSAAVPIG
jgi:hypothetical protein